MASNFCATSASPLYERSTESESDMAFDSFDTMTVNDKIISLRDSLWSLRDNVLGLELHLNSEYSSHPEVQTMLKLDGESWQAASLSERINRVKNALLVVQSHVSCISNIVLPSGPDPEPETQMMHPGGGNTKKRTFEFECPEPSSSSSVPSGYGPSNANDDDADDDDNSFQFSFRITPKRRNKNMKR